MVRRTGRLLVVKGKTSGGRRKSFSITGFVSKPNMTFFESCRETIEVLLDTLFRPVGMM